MSLAHASRRGATWRQSLPSRPDHLSPVMRQRIGDAIDALLLLLDTADGDADLEDGHDAEAIDEREPDDDGDPLDFGEMDETEPMVRFHAS